MNAHSIASPLRAATLLLLTLIATACGTSTSRQRSPGRSPECADGGAEREWLAWNPARVRRHSSST